MKKHILAYALCVSLFIPFVVPQKADAVLPLLIPFIAAAARTVVQGVIASAPAVANVAGRTIAIPLTSSKTMNVALGLSVLVHAAALAINLGYTTQPAAMDCKLSSGFLAGESCSAIVSANSAYCSYTTSPSTYGSAYTKVLPNPIACDDNFQDWPSGAADNPPEEVMWLDMSQNPTQAKTDAFLGQLKVLATTSPPDFDAIVALADQANDQPASDYPNGSTQSVTGGTISVISGPAGTQTIDTAKDLLVDGSLPTTGGGVGGGTGGTGGGAGSGTGATSADIQGVVDAINNKQTDCDKHPNSVGCADLGTATDPVLSSNPVDFSTLHLAPITLILDSTVCPAPDSVMVRGQSVTIDNQPLCDFLGWIRPAVMATAWFASIMLIIGAIRT